MLNLQSNQTGKLRGFGGKLLGGDVCFPPNVIQVTLTGIANESCIHCGYYNLTVSVPKTSTCGGRIAVNSPCFDPTYPPATSAISWNVFNFGSRLFLHVTLEIVAHGNILNLEPEILVDVMRFTADLGTNPACSGVTTAPAEFQFGTGRLCNFLNASCTCVY